MRYSWPRHPKGRHLGLAASLSVLLGVTSACYGPMFKHGGDLLERSNPAVERRRYDQLVTIAGGGGTRIDLQVSVTVRTQLADSGFNVGRRAGRWSDEVSAVRAICAPDAVPPDGVIFVWYDRLELRDCQTEKVAFEVSGTGNQGITAMTDRLILYMRGPTAADPSAADSAMSEEPGGA